VTSGVPGLAQHAGGWFGNGELEQLQLFFFFFSFFFFLKKKKEKQGQVLETGFFCLASLSLFPQRGWSGGVFFVDFFLFLVGS